MRPVRPLRFVGDIAYVPLTQGYEAIIDVADAPLVAGYNWHARVASAGGPGAVYAGTCVITGEGKRFTILLHRLITGAPAGMDVDHIDHSGLNNRRANLRVCTHQQNMANMAARNPLGLKGVKRMGNRYAASIQCRGEWVYLGLYATAREAGAAYRGAATVLNGEFATAA